MREIKFRAWQHHASLHRKPGMYEVRSLEFYTPPETGATQGEVGEAFLAPPNEDAKSSEYFNDVTLMQYTSLKDKNGVEIYEGDLLDITSAGGDRGYVPVVFKDGCFMMEVKYWVNDFYSLNEYDSELYEVIGNIYEHSQLLEK